MATHRLSISYPMFFEGPDGPNRVLVDAVGIIKDSPASQAAPEAYLLSVVHPFVVDGEDVRQLIVTPRFAGDTLTDVTNGASGVNIARVKPGVTLNKDEVYDGSESVGWAIGSLHPQRA